MHKTSVICCWVVLSGLASLSGGCGDTKSEGAGTAKTPKAARAAKRVSQPLEVGWKRYDFPELEFSSAVPDTWEVEQGTSDWDRENITFSSAGSEPKGCGNLSLSIWSWPRRESDRIDPNEIIASLREASLGSNEILERGMTKLDGRDAFRAAYRNRALETSMPKPGRNWRQGEFFIDEFAMETDNVHYTVHSSHRKLEIETEVSGEPFDRAGDPPVPAECQKLLDRICERIELD